MSVDDYKPGALSLFLNPDAGVPDDVLTEADPLSVIERPSLKPAKKRKVPTKPTQSASKGKKRSAPTDDAAAEADSDDEPVADDSDLRAEAAELDHAISRFEEEQKERERARGGESDAEEAEAEEGEEEEEKKVAAKVAAKPKLSPEELEAKRKEEEERNRRTVFVGNVPLTMNQKQIKKIFSQYGAVESVRLRSISFENPKLPRKAAFITKNFHKDRDSCNAYVVFKEEASVEKALAHNGQDVGGKHVRVDRVGASKTADVGRSVFVGNLPFSTTEDSVFEFFSKVCAVESVRIIRDRATNIGKGFGYVLLKSAEEAKTALTLHGASFNQRELRVFKATDSDQLNKKKQSAAANFRTRSQRRDAKGLPAPVKVGKKGKVKHAARRAKAEETGAGAGGDGPEARGDSPARGKKRARSVSRSFEGEHANQEASADMKALLKRRSRSQIRSANFKNTGKGRTVTPVQKAKKGQQRSVKRQKKSSAESTASQKSGSGHKKR